jgi:NCAIR mutase (PurE)-related protein
VNAQRDAGLDVLVTRLEADAAARASAGSSPAAATTRTARLLWFGPPEPAISGKGTVLVVSAGTSDLPVAAESAGVARRYGNRVETLHDVGIAASTACSPRRTGCGWRAC